MDVRVLTYSKRQEKTQDTTVKKDFHPTQIRCPFCRCSRGCTRTTTGQGSFQATQFPFHPTPILCPFCRCSRSCIRPTKSISGHIISIFAKQQYCVRIEDTTDTVPELQILYQKYKAVQDTQFPFSPNTSTVSVLQMQQILYQNYRSCTRNTEMFAGYMLSIFTQDQYCVRVADAADPVPEIQILYQKYRDVCRLHTFHFHPGPILCACCRCSRSCTRTTRRTRDRSSAH